MFDKTQRFYDAIYTSIKDYAAEAASLHELIQRERPGAKTLLDVACGTGLHDSFLRDHYEITGVDLDPKMLTIARARNPGIPYVEGDMITFDLGRGFDVVVCMFSSIGYTKTLEGLRAAAARMAAHLEPGGLLVIEPWLTPDAWKPSHVHAIFVDEPDLKIVRIHSAQPAAGHLSPIEFHYLVGTTSGVEHFIERHEVGLFTVEEYVGALRAAGLDARHEPEGGWANRGLYLGVAPR